MSEMEKAIREIINLAQYGLNEASEFGNDSQPLSNALFNVQAWAKDALAITVTADLAKENQRKSYQYGYSNKYKQDRTGQSNDD